jgi:glyoxylate reductase
MRIVSSFPLPAGERARLAEIAEVVDGESMVLDAAAFFAEVEDADVVVCGPNRVLSPDAGARLRAVCTPSTGVDHIPVDAFRARGIAIGHTAEAVVAPTADMTLMLILAVMRRLNEAMLYARTANWQLSGVALGDDLDGATLGIAGCGAIGSAVGRRAQACGMRVIYHNRSARADDAQTGFAPRSFDDLLAEANCVVALTPLTAQTTRMFDTAAFANMRKGATFVNAGRGALVDHAALAHALSGHLGGAALDVTDPEPLPLDHPLFAMPNVLITPHMGTATRQTRRRLLMQTIDNAMAGLRGEPLPFPLKQ